MITIKVRTSGLKRIIDINKQVIRDIDNGEFEKEVQKKVINRAKYRAPRKSGALVRGIKSKGRSKKSFTVVCDTVNAKGEPYPVFLEYGTRYIKIGTASSPRVIKSSSGKTAFLPFMAWAVWRTMQELDKIFRDKILKKYK